MGGARGRLIPHSDRKLAVELIQEAMNGGATQRGACEVLGISERTYQRWILDGDIKEDGRKDAVRPKPHNKLKPEEEEQILSIIKQVEYVDLPPSQIVPKLIDKGIYIASESSYYRVMRKQKLQNHRGRSKAPKKHQLTTHIATEPNQVWMWDITYCAPIRAY